jgi:hypothetical protein
LVWPDTSYSELRGRKLLITGDVHAGKTRLTRALLEVIVAATSDVVTVIDMAPRHVTVNGLTVGGVLMQPGEFDVRYLRADPIATPRLAATTAEELVALAEHNRCEIEGLLDAYRAAPSKVLVVNDVSMYLQRGELARLWATFALADTVVANGYAGTRLREDLGTGISERERTLMEDLARRLDCVIRL